ncbi:MAG: WD40 repeat domain-containing protein, partial [Acidobacteriales bacterium]|nr:WD40 repeat domain-containing protein [Terriglobales bacterium]
IEKSKAEREQSRLREKAQKAQADEAAARRMAETHELAARKKAYASDMKLLQHALAVDDLAHAQELLNRQRPKTGERDLRGWEWRSFWQFCQSDAAFTLCQRSNSIISVSFSRDGSLLAVGTDRGQEVTVWDLATRRMIFRRGDSSGSAARLAFAPHADTLAFYNVSNNQRSIVLWDAQDRSEVGRLPLTESVRDLAFTREGRLFTADAGITNNIVIWDATRGEALTNFTARPPGYVNGNVFHASPDGGQSVFVPASVAHAHSVRLMDADGVLQQPFRVAKELTTALVFSPDQRVLLTGAGYSEGAIKLWDIATRQPIGSLEGHRSWVGCLKFLPDGKTLVSSSADRTIRLWDFSRRQSVRTLRGHDAEVWTLDVSPDGRWVASGGKDGSVLLWDLKSSTNRPPAYRTLNPGPRWWGASSSPDGRWLGLVQQLRLRLYDTRTLQPLSEPALGLTNIGSFAFSPDGRLLVTTGAKGRVNVWAMPDLAAVTNFVAHPVSAMVRSSSFVLGGKSLLTQNAGHTMSEWDVTTWKQVGQWPMSTSASRWAISDAGLVATATEPGFFELIPIHNPEQRWRFRGQNRIVSIALSPDGKTFAAASENGTVELWDT